MKILTIELYGFKRFRLNQAKSFKMTLSEKIQLILGTNGSGKSSLMEELSPLPAVASNYSRDGYKIIEITHNKAHYRLGSYFSPSQRHSFIKNGIELNEGGTITIQKDLVRQEFGITNAIHDLMTGAEKFTNMSPARKREWFTLLGETDYDYSFAVFNRLRERYRDVQGALKLAKSRLVIETGKIISEKTEQELQHEIHELHRLLSILLENKEPNIAQRFDIQDKAGVLFSELDAISQTLLKLNFQKPSYTKALDINGIEFDIWDYQNQITATEKQIKNEVELHDQLEKSHRIIQKAGNDGLKDLDKKKEPLTQRKRAIRNKQKTGLIFSDPEAVLTLMDTIEPLLFNILPELPKNTEGNYSLSVISQEELLQKTIAQEKLDIENRHRRAVALRAHMEIHRKEGKTECPKCKHVWIRDFSEEEYQKTLKLIEELENKMSDIVKCERTSQERVKSVQEYMVRYREILRIMESTKMLSSFWDAIEDEGLLQKAPTQVLHRFGLLREDLLLEIKFKELVKEEGELDELAKALQKTEATNLEEVTKRIEVSSAKIGELTQQHFHYRKRLLELTQFLELARKTEAYAKQLKVLLDNVDAVRNEEIISIRNESLTFCIREFQSLLANKEKLVSEASLQKRIVEDLKDQIRRLSIEEEASKLLVKNLSPTDGLIAEGLYGFIRSFVRQMNVLIRKTWSYPFEIIPCGTNSDGGIELDYKFPMIVQSQDNPIPDVSKGSTGMMEMIDFAFKITAMKYLGLSNFPIYLDEWARTLDKQHKNNATEVIKNVMDQGNFSQLFLVSHDFNQYGAFGNIETCVLDGNNILVPADYNRHVEMA